MSSDTRPFQVIAVPYKKGDVDAQKMFCVATTRSRKGLPEGVISTAQLRKFLIQLGFERRALAQVVASACAHHDHRQHQRGVVAVHVCKGKDVLVNLRASNDVHGAISPEDLYTLIGEHPEDDLSPIDQLQKGLADVGVKHFFGQSLRVLAINDLVTFSLLYPAGPFGICVNVARKYLKGYPVDRDGKVILSVGNFFGSGICLFGLSRCTDVIPAGGEHMSYNIGDEIQVCATLLALKILSQTPAHIYSRGGLITGAQEYDSNKKVLDMLPLRSYLEALIKEDKPDRISFLLQATDELDYLIAEEVGLLPELLRSDLEHLPLLPVIAKLGRLATLCVDNIRYPDHWRCLVIRARNMGLEAVEELLTHAKPEVPFGCGYLGKNLDAQLRDTSNHAVVEQ